MLYAVQRYAATRPWAKRIGQVFTQQIRPQAAVKEAADIVKAEMKRAAQVYAIASSAKDTELLLAQGFGYFIRHGRLMCHVEEAVAQALAATRIPSHLPSTLVLPAESFFLHVDGEQGGGAFIAHDEESHTLEFILVSHQFSQDPSRWLSDSLMSLSIGYPGELAAQVEYVPETWKPLLAAVLNGLALMTQPKAVLEKAWEPTAPARDVILATDPGCEKTRKKGRSSLLKAGFAEVAYCRMPEVIGAEAYQTQGYWRRQAFGEAKQLSRLVWVMPR